MLWSSWYGTTRLAQVLLVLVAGQPASFRKLVLLVAVTTGSTPGLLTYVQYNTRSRWGTKYTYIYMLLSSGILFAWEASHCWWWWLLAGETTYVAGVSQRSSTHNTCTKGVCISTSLLKAERAQEPLPEDASQQLDSEEFLARSIRGVVPAARGLSKYLKYLNF
jgi:hypothetical protein